MTTATLRPAAPSPAGLLLRATLAAALAMPAAATAAAQGAPPPASYLPALGRAFVAEHCPDGVEPRACEFDAVLAETYAHARLGAFEVWYPARFLSEKKKAEDLHEIAGALLGLQRRWVEVMGADREGAPGVLADLVTLEAWVQGWNPAELGKLANARDARELFAALEAGEGVEAAAQRLREALEAPETLGMAPQHTDGAVDLVISPTRRDFMELVGYLGLVDEEFQRVNWTAGVEQWTQCWSGTKLLLCLEYAPWSGFDPEFRQGISVRKWAPKTGLAQHVLQQAGEALLFRCFNQSELHLIEKGLATNLVVDVVGEANALDGDGGISNSGAATAPYERFVPGGNSSGGTLPAVPAAPMDAVVEGPWRQGHGKDRFVAVLRAGQKEGAKTAAKERSNPQSKDKLAHFLLKGRSKHVVSAPFYGTHANAKPYPPAEFLNDYREFFRAYNTCFLDWLRHRAAGTAERSAERFRELLRALSVPEETPAFHEAVERVYGVALSAENGESQSLEWRFLKWLAEGGK
jgi:hypothetical protein